MKRLICASIAMLAVILGVPAASTAGISLSVNIAPPILPIYEQPPCPVDGYLWVPGYWAYGDEGYFWVPGYWSAPPRAGLLWTPGYWGYEGANYRFHEGYWGPHVGFYGGVNYGFGYTGSGFYGGAWDGSRFRYNTAVTRVNPTVIHNVYNRTVINNVTVNRNSFNGPGGVNVRPNAQEASFSREEHINRTSAQATHEQNASVNRAQFASVNHGQPARPAVERPRGGVNGPQNSPAGQLDRFSGRPPGAATPNVQAGRESQQQNQQNRPAAQPDRFAGRPQGTPTPSVQPNRVAEQQNQQNRVVQQQQNQQNRDNRVAQQEQNRAARQEQGQQTREGRPAQQQQNHPANVEQRQQPNGEHRPDMQRPAEHHEAKPQGQHEPEHKEGDNHPH